MEVQFTLNGISREYEVRCGKILLDLLRDEGYKSVKEGCRSGDCGACAVLVDGRAVNSCLLYVPQVGGRNVRTLEGLDDRLGSILKESFLEESAVQCGFCTPGMIVSAYSLLVHNPDPTERQIRSALDGNLCRCTGYVRIIRAVKRASDRFGD